VRPWLAAARPAQTPSDKAVDEEEEDKRTAGEGPRSDTWDGHSANQRQCAVRVVVAQPTCDRSSTTVATVMGSVTQLSLLAAAAVGVSIMAAPRGPRGVGL
jgi:hypothetical protein